MTPGVRVIGVDLWAVAGVAAFFVLLLVLIARGVYRRPPASLEARAERDWSIPEADAAVSLDSPFHRLDPRVKIASLLCFMFCTAFLGGLMQAGAALGLSAVMCAASRTPLRRAGRRLLAMAGFLGMFLLVMPLTAPDHPGDALLSLGGLVTLNLRGLARAVQIVLKACAVALAAEVLIGTAPLAKTLEALDGLGVPAGVSRALLLAHRYIFVFRDEARRMMTALMIRGFRPRPDVPTLRTLGVFTGMLAVRSFERTERVHDAMRCRGWREAALVAVAPPPPRPRAWALGAAVSALGVLLLAWDLLAAPVAR